MTAEPAVDPSRTVKPFLEHLEDLRFTLIRCALALGIGMAVSIPLAPEIFGLLKRPLAAITDKPDEFLSSLEVVGAFTITLKLALWSGLVLSAPFIIYYAALFILPALTPRERKAISGTSVLGVFLFIFGVLLGYGYTLPFAIKAMFSMNSWLGIQAQWTVSSYISFTIQLLLGFGLAFELPVVLLILGRIGLVSSRFLSARRRHAVLVILIIAAVLTPPDVVSQLLMSIPLYAFFEVCIWIIRGWEKSRVKRDAESGV
jgi:sec-independent protein translocase protein TatC